MAGSQAKKILVLGDGNKGYKDLFVVRRKSEARVTVLLDIT